MRVLTRPKMRVSQAARKGFPCASGASDPYHPAAAYTYRRLCSRKKLAYAWRIDPPTAGRYRNGRIVGALTRLTWEIVLLQRAGIDPRPIIRFLIRVVRHEERRFA